MKYHKNVRDKTKKKKEIKKREKNIADTAIIYFSTHSPNLAQTKMTRVRTTHTRRYFKRFSTDSLRYVCRRTSQYETRKSPLRALKSVLYSLLVEFGHNSNRKCNVLAQFATALNVRRRGLRESE